MPNAATITRWLAQLVSQHAFLLRLSYGDSLFSSAMTIWLAGGGAVPGTRMERRMVTAVEDVHHSRDVHVRLLRLSGLDDTG